jgi:hypothetical protein
MDPYLESPTYWSDFHATFACTLSESINDHLPRNYVCRIGRHESMTDRAYDPPEASSVPDSEVSRADAPVTLRDVEFIGYRTEPYLQILHVPDQSLVTVVELISPTTKYGDGRGEYMHRRKELRNHSINHFGLDLLRAGSRFGFNRPLPPGHYYAFVSRASRPGCTDVFPWSVRSPLPALPIPLRPPDDDVLVSLADPFATAYERGRYWKLIDYMKAPPVPPFASDDAEWVAQTARAVVKPS